LEKRNVANANANGIRDLVHVADPMPVPPNNTNTHEASEIARAY
jgi:hypothetical protein